MSLVRSITGNQPEICAYTDADTLLRALNSGECMPDIALLDIQMDGMNGVELAGVINRSVPECEIIFLTGYGDYASDVYTTRHVWFVLKDRAEDYLRPALQKAMDNLRSAPDELDLVIRRDRKIVRVPLEKIVYIERVARKYHLYYRDGEDLDAQLASDLSAPAFQDRLLRCHQGFWVNIRYIRQLDRGELVLDGGRRIPVSRSYREKVRERFFNSRRL